MRHEPFQLAKVTIITDRTVRNCCATGLHWFALEKWLFCYYNINCTNSSFFFFFSEIQEEIRQRKTFEQDYQRVKRKLEEVEGRRQLVAENDARNDDNNDSG